MDEPIVIEEVQYGARGSGEDYPDSAGFYVALIIFIILTIGAVMIFTDSLLWKRIKVAFGGFFNGA